MRTCSPRCSARATSASSTTRSRSSTSRPRSTRRSPESGLFKGDDLALIEEFGSNENEHVAALEATAKKLGEPAPKPETKFDLKDADTVLKTAAEVENLGAAAYLGQAANIEDRAILEAALSIHTVEGRHAAALNQVLAQTITPDGAFAMPATAEEVLPEVQPFIVS